jgi:hypothetical protein
VHPEAEVASHQALAAEIEDVQPGAAGDQDVGEVAVGVEEAFEERPPIRILVELVEDQQRFLGPQDLQPELAGQRRRAAADDLLMIEVVPVQVAGVLSPAGRFPCRRRLADLAGSIRNSICRSSRKCSAISSS